MYRYVMKADGVDFREAHLRLKTSAGIGADGSMRFSIDGREYRICGLSPVGLEWLRVNDPSPVRFDRDPGTDYEPVKEKS